MTPREQRGYRNGTWSKGRARTLRWLATTADTARFPHEQDRAAAAAAVRHGAGAGKQVPVEALLFELAGHPQVFDEAGAPVEIVRTEPELLIEQTAAGVRAVLDPEYWEDDRFHAWMADARRCEVIRLTDAHRRLRTIVPHSGLDLPAGARARLLEAVAALVAVVRVHGGVEGGAGSARRVEADPEPRVRLEPLGGGVSAELAVEPIAGSETRFTPGAGGTLVFAQLAGESVQARRDLDAERAAAGRLLEACPRLAAAVPGTWSVELPEALDALELLEQLDAAGARCLWPQGERFRIVKRADSNALRLQIKTAEDWLQASGELRIDPQRAVDLKQLFAALDANPGSRFLELGAGRVRGAHRGVPPPVGGPAGRFESGGGRRGARGAGGRGCPGGADRPGAARRRPAVAQPEAAAAGGAGIRARGAEHPAGRVAPLPGGGLRLAGPPEPLGRGCMPGGRHGARQDGAGARPVVGARRRRTGAGGGAHLGGGELAGRGAPLRTDVERGAVRGAEPVGAARR